MPTFENWFADILSQSRSQVHELLSDQTAIQFLIAWSIFESRCFAGYLKLADIETYAESCATSGFKTEQVSSHLLHFFQRYQDPNNRGRLWHQQKADRFHALVKRDVGTLSSAEWVYFAICVVYRFRNNIFHGNKGVWSWLQYADQISRCVVLMQAFISHEEAIEPRLRMPSAA